MAPRPRSPAASPRRWPSGPTPRRRRALPSRRVSSSSRRSATGGKPLRDVVAPGLDVLFCGINPSPISAERGHHFARPGNRFWPALHGAGFTPRLLHPSEQRLLLKGGYGITNLVNRATATADELASVEFVSGRRRLAAKVRRYRPASVVFLGVGAYRHAFGRPKAAIGRQPETFEGAEIWVLPNPSGLNANYQLAALARLFRALRKSTALRARAACRPASRCAATPPCSGPRTRSRSRSRARSSRTR